MSQKDSAYVAACVAMRRTERQLARAEDAWQCWLRRVELATRLGEADLAAMARRRALRSAELAVTLHGLLAAQRSDTRD